MFKDFKPVLLILGRFLAIYLIPVLLYQFYLNQYSGQGLDPISTWVAKQSGAVQTFLGYATQVIPGKPEHETAWFFIEGKWPTRMVEGCNAISIMILFAAFIFAFYKGTKTFVFAAVGLVLLHIMNVLRIAGLNILIFEKPEYGKIGHDYFFPAIIYGTVVVLWIVWIKFFALKDENS